MRRFINILTVPFLCILFYSCTDNNSVLSDDIIGTWEAKGRILYNKDGEKFDLDVHYILDQNGTYDVETNNPNLTLLSGGPDPIYFGVWELEGNDQIIFGVGVLNPGSMEDPTFIVKWKVLEYQDEILHVEVEVDGVRNRDMILQKV